jgi:hypothetical protein
MKHEYVRISDLTTLDFTFLQRSCSGGRRLFAACPAASGDRDFGFGSRAGFITIWVWSGLKRTFPNGLVDKARVLTTSSPRCETASLNLLNLYFAQLEQFDGATRDAIQPETSS